MDLRTTHNPRIDTRPAGRHVPGLERGTTRRRFLAGAAAIAAAPTAATLLESIVRRPVAAAAGSLGAIRVVGDSLTVGSLPYQADALTALGWTDVAIDAYGGRGITTKMSADPHTGLTAVDALRAEHGDATWWIVALGTNDSGIHASGEYVELIERMLDRIGAGHQVMWVNVYMPSRPSSQWAWNAALDTVATARPDQLVVYEWAAVAAQHEAWLSADSIHYLGTGYSARSTAVAAAVTALAAPPGPALRTSSRVDQVVATDQPAGFQPVTPVRIVDSRTRGKRWAGGEWHTVDLSDHVPADAIAVAVNLTAVNPTRPGYLTVAASPGVGTPSVASLNTGTVAATAGHVITPIADDRTCAVFVRSDSDVVIDLAGYYAPDAPLGLTMQTPRRLLDTRTTGDVRPTGTITLQVPATNGVVPEAAVFNITAVGATEAANVTAWPADAQRPVASCLNVVAGDPAVANLVQVALDADGRVSLRSSGGCALVVDLLATYDRSADGLRFRPVEPTRVLDTRDGRGGWAGVTAPGQSLAVTLGTDAPVVVGVLAATPTKRAGWIATAAGTSALNLHGDRVVSNAVIGAPAARVLTLLQGAGGGEHLLLDVTGVFVAP